MTITQVKLERFKRVESVTFELKDVNVLIGGNNSGKSSILQGIHFSVIAAVTAKAQGQQTFAAEALMYSPTPDFSVLRHGSPYVNQEGAGNSVLTFRSDLPEAGEPPVDPVYEVTISKGRNHGNIACKRTGDQRMGNVITDTNTLFSIYVPGLAGVAQSEELKSKAIVKRGVASGDANLYLRNILFYIKESGKLDELNDRLAAVFPGVQVKIRFDLENDQILHVNTLYNGKEIPIELAGTGLLQAIQIFSYVTYFSPKLLLLDEPDSHLHPDNQRTLCEAISAITETSRCQVIVSTHSRHMIQSLYENGHFVWLKDGEVRYQGSYPDRLSLLLDLGALDTFDQLRAGVIRVIMLTEDRDKKYLEKLLEANNFPMSEVLVYSYGTTSNIEGAKLFVEFLKDVSPTSKVIVHRDRDFMTDQESAGVARNISSAGAIPYITDGSDIESHFVSVGHLAELCEIAEVDVRSWLDDLARVHHNELQHDFTRKRDEIRNKLYKSNPSACPDTLALIGSSNPLEPTKRKGKFMIKKVRGSMSERIGFTKDLLAVTSHLSCETLVSIRNDTWPTQT